MNSMKIRSMRRCTETQPPTFLGKPITGNAEHLGIIVTHRDDGLHNVYSQLHDVIQEHLLYLTNNDVVPPSLFSHAVIINGMSIMDSQQFVSQVRQVILLQRRSDSCQIFDAISHSQCAPL